MTLHPSAYEASPLYGGGLGQGEDLKQVKSYPAPAQNPRGFPVHFQ